MRLFRLLRKRTKRSLLLTTIGMAGGYFFDPQMGPARRRRLVNWAKQLPAVGRRLAERQRPMTAGTAPVGNDGVVLDAAVR